MRIGLDLTLKSALKTGPPPDTTAPTVQITCAQFSPSATTPLNFTFILSEASVDFAVGDITATILGGTVTKSNFAGSGAVYTCDLAPDVSGTMTVDVASGAFHDAVGNGNTAATQFTFTVIVFILNDDFITTAAAPLASPRTCEPGPGTLTLVQNDGQYSIADKALVIPVQSTPDWLDQGFYSSAALIRVAGLAIFQHVLSVQTAMSLTYINQLRTSAGINYPSEHFVNFDANGVQPENWRLNHGAPTSVGIYGVILRSGGAYYLLDDFVYWGNVAPSTATLYSTHLNRAGAINMGYHRVGKLPAPFDSVDALSVYRSASVADGTVIAGEKDGTIKFTWTPAAGNILNVRFRRIDDDNCMIMRLDQGTSKWDIFKRVAGVETSVASRAYTWTAGTPYACWMRFDLGTMTYGKDATSVDPTGSSIQSFYNLNKTGIKFDGTSVTNVDIVKCYLADSYLSVWDGAINPFLNESAQVINLADGGDINAAVATMKRGGTLNLAANGSYTLGAGVNGFASIPNGYSNTYKTIINGNGATITGGTIGFYTTSKKFFDLNDINFVDQTIICADFEACRNFAVNSCTFKTTVGVLATDATRFNSCRDFQVVDCEVKPSTGISSFDGFECYGNCENGIFINCIAHGVVDGFESWTGASPNWANYDIQFVNCEAYNNTIGFSCEGGAQSVAHESIICDGCSSHDNSTYGYQGIQGSTLYRQNLGGTNNTGNGTAETFGSVTDL